MRRIIACVIVGLVTAIAIYHFTRKDRSIHTDNNLPVTGNAVEHVHEKIVFYFPLPVRVTVCE